MKTINDIQASYIAGIVDGEGNISIDKKYLKLNPTFGLDCSVHNNSLDLIRWLRDATWIGTTKPKARKNPNWKPGWVWWLRAHEIEPLLTRILPFMIVRCKHAELMLKFLETKRYAGPYYPMTQEEYDYRNQIFEELKLLNERGVKR